MDAQDQDFLLSGSVVRKGRRTKRHRSVNPITPPLPVDSEDTVSASASASFSGSVTEEDEDIANCLILLSRGDQEPSSKLSPAATAAADDDASAPQSYECKTCSKTFPSFQALGGHRASHKKPKLSPPPPVVHDDKKIEEVVSVTIADTALQMMSSVNSVPTAMAVSMSIGRNNSSVSVKANKIHECAICGAEFTSGQALGGHMRRHRPATVATIANNSAETTTTSSQEVVVKKEKGLLGFDLNLPAEDVMEQQQQQQFVFEAVPEKTVPPAVTQPLLFRSSLVDCHY